MRLRMLMAIVGCLALVGLAMNSYAEFEPLFKITKITGECQVRKPGDGAFSPAEDNKAYPYGTRIKTGMRSTAVVVFSEDNTCRILANAELTIAEGTIDKSLKRILLDEGEVEVELDEEFDKSGDKLNVETATAICGAIGCHFRVASQMEDELRVIIVRCVDGSIRVTGQFFNIAEMGKDDWVSLISPDDQSFLRLKNMKGEFSVLLREGESGERTVETEEGMVLKIWQQDLPGTDKIAVSVSIVDKDGRLIETIVATIDKPTTGTGTEPVTEPTTEPTEPTSEPTTGKNKPNWDGVTTTTTTTTTTTVHSPTPVGLR